MAGPKKSQSFDSSMVTNILLAVVLFFGIIGTCTNMSVSKKTNEVKLHVTEQVKIDMYEHDSLLLVEFDEILDKRLDALRVDINTDFYDALYNFLIYEDDLDKGKISLSEIRNLLLKEKNGEGNENNTE